MKKSFCLWCFKEKLDGESWFFEFDQSSDFHFCSKKCLTAASVKRGKDKHIDMEKIRKHAGKLLREKKRCWKTKDMTRLMAQEKIGNEDIPLLFSLLTARQKKVLAIVGLSNLSWSVHGNPNQLMEKIESLESQLRR